jgi:hypothetical protein
VLPVVGARPRVTAEEVPQEEKALMRSVKEAGRQELEARMWVR